MIRPCQMNEARGKMLPMHPLERGERQSSRGVSPRWWSDHDGRSRCSAMQVERCWRYNLQRSPPRESGFQGRLRSAGTLRPRFGTSAQLVLYRRISPRSLESLCMNEREPAVCDVDWRQGIDSRNTFCMRDYNDAARGTRENSSASSASCLLAQAAFNPSKQDLIFYPPGVCLGAAVIVVNWQGYIFL